MLSKLLPPCVRIGVHNCDALLCRQNCAKFLHGHIQAQLQPTAVLYKCHASHKCMCVLVIRHSCSSNLQVSIVGQAAAATNKPMYTFE